EWFAGDNLRRIVVQAVPPSQQSKEAARTMYVDQSPPPAPREAARPVFRERGAGRPTKKERREIEKWRRGLPGCDERPHIIGHEARNRGRSPLCRRFLARARPANPRRCAGRPTALHR